MSAAPVIAQEANSFDEGWPSRRQVSSINKFATKTTRNYTSEWVLFACDVLSSSPYFPCVALYNDSLTRLWSAQVSGTVDKVNSRETWRLNALNAWGINIFYCPAHATCPPTTGVLNSELVSAIHFAEAKTKCARAAFICYLNSEWVCFIFLQHPGPCHPCQKFEFKMTTN